jgi:nitrate reductase gamma subunit
MIMAILLYVVIYISALVFLIACTIRAVHYARLPLHLRWELYPVPHEEPERAKHGGSYFESTDWWKKPTPFNLLGELKSMLPEMLLQKGLWEFNRRMWFVSFPFHFGLYLIIGSTALLMATALLTLLAPQFASGGSGLILHYVYAVGWLAGAALAVGGALALLVRRLTDKELTTYTVPADIFNLLFFILTLGCLFSGYLLQRQGAPGALGLARGVLSFDTTLRFPPMLAMGLAMGALLTAYIPMTHMSHFIAKYFTYHAVRWDDRPSRRGSVLEKRVAEYLTYRPRWAAPHVGADGTKTWADIAMSNPARGVKK